MQYITPAPVLSWSTAERLFHEFVGSADVLKCHFNVTLLLQRTLCLNHIQFVKSLSSRSFSLVCELFMWVNYSCLILEPPCWFFLVEFHPFAFRLHLPVSCKHFQFYLVCPVLAVPCSFFASSGFIYILSSLSIWVTNENREMIHEPSIVFFHVVKSFITPLDGIQPVGNPVSHMALFKLVLPFMVVWWAKTDI